MSIKDRVIRLAGMAVVCAVFIGMVWSPKFAFFVAVAFISALLALWIYGILFGND